MITTYGEVFLVDLAVHFRLFAFAEAVFLHIVIRAQLKFKAPLYKQPFA